MNTMVQVIIKLWNEKFSWLKLCLNEETHKSLMETSDKIIMFCFVDGRNSKSLKKKLSSLFLESICTITVLANVFLLCDL